MKIESVPYKQISIINPKIIIIYNYDKVPLNILFKIHSKLWQVIFRLKLGIVEHKIPGANVIKQFCGKLPW
jgi:hypothetical protein